MRTAFDFFVLQPRIIHETAISHNIASVGDIHGFPGVVKTGTKCDEPICHTDIYATCAAVINTTLAGAEAEDSFSLLTLIRGENGAKRGAPVIHHSATGMFAIRDGKWSIVLGNGSGGRQAPIGKPFKKPYHLFDLAADIAETTNLLDQHADVAVKLEASFKQIRDSGRSVNW